MSIIANNQSTFSSPKNTQYLFIDMNAFFASCEQQANPNYRHRPVAVTPYAGKSGCVISPSYEAKALGIKTGTSVGDAQKICPNIIIVESNVNDYLQIHNKLKQILFSFSPFVRVMSVDEAAIKLSPSEQTSKIAKNIALFIKQKIYDSLGKYMRSSIGIGPNIYLSKQAAEFEKPDGLTEIKLNKLPYYYEQIKLRDLKGINFRIEARLNSVGFYKPIELYLTSANNLRKKMGIMGEYWHLNLHGYDVLCNMPNSSNNKEDLPKSIGHSHVLEPKYRNWISAWAVCQKLITRAAMRLREQDLNAGGVSLYIGGYNHFRFLKGVKVPYFSDSFTFTRQIKFLWDQIDKQQTPMHIGVKMFNIAQSRNNQISIFPKEDKIQKIFNSVDLINDKYGSFTIQPASILFAEDSAPNRIAFGKPIYE